MAEFQKKRAHEELLGALRNMGLEISSEIKPVPGRGAPMGPGETAPADMAEVPALAPSYLPPAPAEPVPAEPLEPDRTERPRRKE